MRPLQTLRADALGKGRKSGWTRSLALALTIAWFGACEDPVAVSCSFLSEPISDAPYLYACPEELGLDPSALEAVLAMVQGFVDDGSIVGGELMLVKNERIVLHEAVGWDDPVRGLGLDRNSIYRIRSMTKPFVGTSILLLVAEGLLDLGDSVRTYVPAFDNERSRDIIIRQLLTHTAGYVQGGWPSTFSHFSSLREAVDAVGQMGPHQPPGDGYVYSDLNTATLGAIVEELSGMTLDRFIETRVLGPTGLSDTYTRFTPGVPWAGRMNATHFHNGDAWEQYWDPTMEQVFPFFRASGGLYSTVFDYALFLEMWAGAGEGRAGRLLPEELARQALLDTAEGAGAYGYQWEIWSQPAPTRGLPTFGHTGFNGTLGGVAPETGAMVLYFTQSSQTSTLGPVAVAAFEALER